MKPIKTLVLGVSVAALGMGVFSPAMADNSGVSDHVKKVELSFPGQAAVVHVKNISQNKLASKVKLQSMENALGFEIDGLLQCAADSDVTDAGAKVYFGPVTLQNQDINAGATLDNEDITISASTWGVTGFAKKGYLTENADSSLYEVPLNTVKNGHPALRVDPIAEIEKSAQDFVNNGGTLADFYKSDREIVIKRPISLAGWCKKGSDRTAGFHTKDHVIQIKYEGDPAVYQVALNAQLTNNNMPNQVQQNPDLPFQLNDIEFQSNMPNYVGKCLPDQNPKIRVNFNVAGGKQGLVDLRIKEEGNQYADYGNFFETSGIVKDPKNAGHLDFSFPLKEMLSQDKYAFMMQLNNQTYSHNMVIEARFKNFDGSNEWSQWKEYDNAVFKHRCTPQVIPQGQNGGMGGYDNGGNTPPPINGTIRAVPTSPKPIDKIKAQETPEPMKIKRAQ